MVLFHYITPPHPISCKYVLDVVYQLLMNICMAYSLTEESGSPTIQFLKSAHWCAHLYAPIRTHLVTNLLYIPQGALNILSLPLVMIILLTCVHAYTHSLSPPSLPLSLSLSLSLSLPSSLSLSLFRTGWLNYLHTVSDVLYDSCIAKGGYSAQFISDGNSPSGGNVSGISTAS